MRPSDPVLIDPASAVGGLETAAPPDPGRVRFPALEGLRGLAAVSIVAYHAAIDTKAILSSAAGAALARLDVGVAVFFVLSGFLLYRPFVVAHLAGRSFPRLTPYLRNRFLRIFPAWWLAFGVVTLGLHRIGFFHPVDVFLYVSLLVGYVPHLFVLNGLYQSWTLTLEITFYVALPLFAWVVTRRRGDVRTKARAHLAAVVGAGALGLALRAYAASADPGTGWLIRLPTEMALFAIGMAFAVSSARSQVIGNDSLPARTLGRHPAVSWLLAAAAYWWLSYGLGLPVRDTLVPLTTAQEMGRHVLFGVVALFLVAPAVFGDQRRGLIRRVLGSRPLSALGLVSYGVYLWHADLMRGLLIGPGDPLRHVSSFRYLTVFGATLVLTLAVASVSYFVVEKPALRLKARS
ncbi:MAG TPA: acyltransferase [Acidimicrobiales bacterium]|nr:acyltransferase [Acidimicrobiales bacterium]